MARQQEEKDSKQIEGELTELLQKDILFDALMWLLDGHKVETLAIIDGKKPDREKQGAIDERRGYTNLKEHLESLRNSGTS